MAGSRYSLAAAKAVVQRAVPASRELRRVGNGRRCRHPGVATSWLAGRGWRASNPMGACHPFSESGGLELLRQLARTVIEIYAHR